MFSQTSYKILAVLIHLAELFCVSPVQFNDKNLLFICNENARYRKRMQGNLVLSLAWVFALICRIGYYYQENDLDRMYLGIPFSLGIWVAALVLSISVRFPREICRMTNGLFQLFQHLNAYTSSPAPGTARINRIHDGLLCLVAISLFMFNISLLIFLILDPTGCLFVGRTLSPRICPFPLKTLLLLLHMYSQCTLFANCAFISAIGLMYGFYVTLFYTKELRIGLTPESYRTHDKLRNNPSNLIHIYRAFQILHKQALYVFGPYLLILNATFMGHGVYSSFVLFRYWPNLKMFTRIPLLVGDTTVFVTWTLVMELGKILSNRGAKILNSWRRHRWNTKKENMTMKRFRVSCKPLLLSYGTQFKLTNRSTFIFYKGVVRGTCKVLLATK